MENKELYKGFLTSMRGITSSVNIISSQSEEKKHAMTASSVASLSLDPPSMLICVNKQASIHKILGPGKFFCINVLAKDQSDLANLCSSSEEGDARFNDVHWSYDEVAPYNTASASNILCKCFDTFQHTSHTVFFGEVVKVLNNNKEGPLLYGNGGYKS
jgi:flavin reductase (DIM6/NTAB) family NADH-FMN oxidoreductase RutF|tara:strand:- start:1535 stop:2011 length:477 start_codon:yes stop_codon:yes gene_type:complete